MEFVLLCGVLLFLKKKWKGLLDLLGLVFVWDDIWIIVGVVKVVVVLKLKGVVVELLFVGEVLNFICWIEGVEVGE